MNSNNYQNGTYQLRATLWDSDANASLVFYSETLASLTKSL